MQLPKIIEFKGNRVLTTKQIAEMYDTTQEKVRWNFKYNKSKYVLGKHYYLIEGEELRQLKRECGFQTLLKQTKSICLWTEKGALLHAKSLNTDKAWEVYDYLVDFYFRIKEEKKASISEKAKANVRMVVDAPDNPEILEAIRKIENDTICMNVLLGNLKRYIDKEKYEERRRVAADLVSNLIQDWTALLNLQPNLIEKI